MFNLKKKEIKNISDMIDEKERLTLQFLNSVTILTILLIILFMVVLK